MNEQPDWLNELNFPEVGLLPVVVQDDGDNRVLMAAYADREALLRTVRDRKAWFYSRSRQCYWLKGETSGNILHVKSIAYDCDGDTLLYRVHPDGPACHTGEASCFFRKVDLGEAAPRNDPVDGEPGGDPAFLQYLHQLVRRRIEQRPEGSYVAGLADAGEDRILQKIGEEAVEVLLAGKRELTERGPREEFLGEAADLLFHLTVFLGYKQVDWREIIKVLERRHRSS